MFCYTDTLSFPRFSQNVLGILTAARSLWNKNVAKYIITIQLGWLIKKDDLAFVMVLFSTCRIRDFCLLVSRKNTVKEERRWKKFGKISNANLCFDNKQHHSNFWNCIKMRWASALNEILGHLQISFLFGKFMVLYTGKD